MRLSPAAARPPPGRRPPGGFVKFGASAETQLALNRIFIPVYSVKQRFELNSCWIDGKEVFFEVISLSNAFKDVVTSTIPIVEVLLDSARRRCDNRDSETS